MEILFYRYNSICEPDIIEAFRALELTVVEEKTQITKKDTTAVDTIDAVSALLQKHRFLFVFSINFFPALSEICRVYNTPYVCWTVDSPVLELFSPSLANPCNRIFYFDRAQYLYFRHINPEHSFHLPLATNTDRWAKVIRKCSGKYRCEISFVGSLYSEKNPCHKLRGISEHTRGYIDGLVNIQQKLYDCNVIPSSLSDRLMQEFSEKVPDLHQPLCEDNNKAQRYLVAHSFIGSELAEVERTHLLNRLSENHSVHLYTFSDTKALPLVHSHTGVSTLTEMPQVFHESRINLNITMRPIETGLSLRVFDICGCGGFLLCNYQEELPELYEPGTEAEWYGSEEELLDKAAYYLSHEEERKKIAAAGLERTRSQHTYLHRISEMIRLIHSTL